MLEHVGFKYYLGTIVINNAAKDMCLSFGCFARKRCPFYSVSAAVRVFFGSCQPENYLPWDISGLVVSSHEHNIVTPTNGRSLL